MNPTTLPPQQQPQPQTQTRPQTPSALQSTPARRQVELPAMRLVQSPRWVGTLAKMLVTMLLLTIPAMGFVPWQQTSRGDGRVVAFAPLDRQQTIDAPISGRISQWQSHIVEGVQVKQGDVLLVIQDNDPDLISRLEQRSRQAENRLEQATQNVLTYENQVERFTQAREHAVRSAEKLVEMSKKRLDAEEQQLDAAKAQQTQAQLNYERQTKATERGLTARMNLEIHEREFRQAQAKVRRATALVASAKAEVEAMEANLKETKERQQSSVNSAQIQLQSARAQQAGAEGELVEIQSRLASQQRQVVTAPRDGTIMRLLVNQEGQMVKFGDPLAVLVPETAERAVELWIHGNDVPLVTPGRHVRLQFEGWPAVQFAGWPSVAVGTFGGEVAVVDATDDGSGRFRVLIQPDEDQDWPSERFLRQGVRANGWVLLNRVTLGYEIWRQLNGFPPVLEDEPKAGKDDVKKIKLPK